MKPAVIAVVGLCCSTLVSAQTLQPGFNVQKPKVAPGALQSAPVPEIDIFLTGAVRDAATKKETPSAVTGSMGLRYRGDTFIIAGLINIAAKEDTVRDGFGQTLLPPSSGRALKGGLLDVRARHLPFRGNKQRCEDPAKRDSISCHWGMHAYATTSSSRWATSTVNDTVRDTREVPMWGTGWQGSYTFFNDMLTDSTKVAMILDFGLATRHVRGDLAGDGATRIDLLGTKRRNFYGSEIALNLQYNTIQAGITYYYFKAGGVDGFSRGQVVAGVSLQSNLNSKPLLR